MFTYSFLIPHKNIPSLLKRCLDSIPSRPDIEIIVVDDNSNAESIKELKRINRKELRIIYTTENKGAGFARNIAVANAHGKWILFADADDFFFQNLLEKLDRYKKQAPPIVLFHSCCRCSDNTKEPGKRQKLCEAFSKKLEDFQNKKINAVDLFLGLGVPWAKMIQLSFLRKNNICFEEVKYSNDIGWVTQLAIKAHDKDITISQDLLYCLTDRKASLYYTRDKEAFYCRFDVRYRQHEQLRQNGITSYFSFCPYVDEARKFGMFFLLDFYKYILQSNHRIPAIYKFEKMLHLKTPYFYLLIQIVKEILGQIRLKKSHI